eukprot:354069-Chlamydomonas_euryale.AAC.2
MTAGECPCPVSHERPTRGPSQDAARRRCLAQVQAAASREVGTQVLESSGRGRGTGKCMTKRSTRGKRQHEYANSKAKQMNEESMKARRGRGARQRAGKRDERRRRRGEQQASKVTEIE